MTEINPLEYLLVLWRRRILFLSIFGIIFFISIIYAFNWNNYKAIATVEVAPPEIAVGVLGVADPSSVSIGVLADLQISRLRQKVLSTNSLAEIITRLNLYPNARKNTPIAYIAVGMRNKIKLELKSTSLANPASAQKASALQLSAIAFELSFKYSDPYLAQQTVNELVSRFLDEDIKDRRNTASKTSEFLQGQINVLNKSLAEQEKTFADFRIANGDLRPEALAFNQQAIIATTSRLQTIESKLMAEVGLMGALRAQLAQTDPYSKVREDGEIFTTPSMQLKMLKSQYATLTAKYGPEHPDVVKISRQMKALQRNIKPSSETASIRAKINDIDARLSRLKEEYGADHPDVTSLKSQRSKLKKKILSLNKSGFKGIKDSNDFSIQIKSDADNPLYMQIVTQFEAADSQKKAFEMQIEEIKKQQEEYRLAIAENPESEKKFAALARDYENSIALYRELKAKKLAAEINETIEQGRIGQRLSIINSPELPRGTSPSRKVFALAGGILALMVSTGCVILLQIINRTVMGPYHLESLIGTAPLVTIPNIRTLESRIKTRTFFRKVLKFMPVALIILVFFFFLLVMPFDVFWEVMMRKVGM